MLSNCKLGWGFKVRHSSEKWIPAGVIGFLAMVVLLPMNMYACQADQNRGAAIFPAETDAFLHIEAPANLIDEILNIGITSHGDNPAAFTSQSLGASAWGLHGDDIPVGDDP